MVSERKFRMFSLVTFLVLIAAHRFSSALPVGTSDSGPAVYTEPDTRGINKFWSDYACKFPSDNLKKKILDSCQSVNELKSLYEKKDSAAICNAFFEISTYESSCEMPNVDALLNTFLGNADVCKELINVDFSQYISNEKNDKWRQDLLRDVNHALNPEFCNIYCSADRPLGTVCRLLNMAITLGQFEDNYKEKANDLPFSRESPNTGKDESQPPVKSSDTKKDDSYSAEEKKDDSQPPVKTSDTKKDDSYSAEDADTKKDDSQPPIKTSDAKKDDSHPPAEDAYTKKDSQYLVEGLDTGKVSGKDNTQPPAEDPDQPEPAVKDPSNEQDNWLLDSEEEIKNDDYKWDEDEYYDDYWFYPTRFNESNEVYDDDEDDDNFIDQYNDDYDDDWFDDLIDGAGDRDPAAPDPAAVGEHPGNSQSQEETYKKKSIYTSYQVMTYCMLLLAFLFIAYIAFHQRQKIGSIMVKGKDKQTRRNEGKAYHSLDQKL